MLLLTIPTNTQQFVLSHKIPVLLVSLWPFLRPLLHDEHSVPLHDQLVSRHGHAKQVDHLSVENHRIHHRVARIVAINRVGHIVAALLTIGRNYTSQATFIHNR